MSDHHSFGFRSRSWGVLQKGDTVGINGRDRNEIWSLNNKSWRFCFWNNWIHIDPSAEVRGGGMVSKGGRLRNQRSSPEIWPLSSLCWKDILNPSNFLGKVIKRMSQDHSSATAWLDANEMMQIFLLSTRIRREDRDSNDTSFETCLRSMGRHEGMRGSQDERSQAKRPRERS